MRLIVSAPTENPLVWSVTKIENFSPIGLQKLTLYQDFYNEHTDYIEKDDDGNIIGMYADYYDSNITPSDDIKPSFTDSIYGKIIASNSTIKVGGSYKQLTLKIYDSSGTDITSNYSSSTFSWSCSIGDEDLTEKVSWLNSKEFNQKKIKFPDDRKYLGKVLQIKCIVSDDNTQIESMSGFDLLI